MVKLNVYNLNKLKKKDFFYGRSGIHSDIFINILGCVSRIRYKICGGNSTAIRQYYKKKRSKKLIGYVRIIR